MKRNLPLILVLIIIFGTAAVYHYHTKNIQEVVVSKPVPGVYADSIFGFSFTYDPALPLTETTLSDSREFPGATAVKMIQIGKAGDVLVYEVSSPGMTVTDEPDGHASPIAQTKYFWDTNAKTWMIAYPEGNDTGATATSTAVKAGTTVGGLPIFNSGRRFDTRIIPLSPTAFVVVTTGGGASSDAITASVTSTR